MIIIPFLLAFVFCGYADEELVLNLEQGINLALSSDRRIGGPLAALSNAEINLELVESDFDLKITPKGDAGYVGGGDAGAGFTIGTGVELYRKFTTGTRLYFRPSFMKAAHDYRTNLQTSITQPLLRGFGRDYTLSPLYGAQFANRSACRGLYLAQIRLILQTIHGMYEIARQRAFVALEQESLERIQKFCTSTQMKEKIGLCDALDVYRAETELKRAEESLDQSQDRLQDAKDSLRDILALPLDQPLDVDVLIDWTPSSVMVEQAIDVALKNRIEIDQAEDALSESYRLNCIAKKNLDPELNLVVDYSSFRRDEILTRAWTNKRESKWGVGLTTSTDVLMLSETAAFERSILATEDAERNLQQVNDNIILEVKRAIRGLKRAQTKIANQETQIENAHKEFYLSRLKFEHGLANNFDMVQAEKNLRSAENGLVSSVIDHKVGEFRLLAVLGILADKP